MDVSRRGFLRGAATVAGLALAGPVVGRAGTAFGLEEPPPCTATRRRLVLIDLDGGNDGLNTVVPMDAPGAETTDTRRAVYEQVRGPLALPRERLLPIGDDGSGPLGLHHSLPTLKGLWDDQRVAIVQGVDYPNHNYSHFVSGDIWKSGDPDHAPQSGWLGRHLDRVGVAPTELRALALGPGLPLTLQGTRAFGAQLLTIPPAFVDGSGAAATALHEAYGGFAGYPSDHPLRHRYGATCGAVGNLVAKTSGMSVSTVPPEAFVRRMLGARALLEAPLGVEIVTVTLGGFDTHANQLGTHEGLLRQLDLGLEAFFLGSYRGTPLGIDALRDDLADRTIVMTFSEFGRRIGANETGTDHGAAGPLFLVGPGAAGCGTARLAPGFHGAHSPLGTTTLPHVNLTMTTDLRSVYQAVLTRWLSQPTDEARRDEGDLLFPAPLAGLFT